LAPIIVGLILALSNAPLSLSALLIWPLAFADFCLTKSYFGPGLVGLRWHINEAESSTFPFVVCFSRPLPFVASIYNSNIFWVSLLSSAMFDALLLVALAAARGFGWATFAVVLLGLTMLNILAFIRCYRIAKMAADMAARSLLLDASARFQAAGDVSPSGTNCDDVWQPDGALMTADERKTGAGEGIE
jgi:hypothetical protein